MNTVFFKGSLLFLIVGSWLLYSDAIAAPPTPATLKAKQEAEAKGYIFETSHDEIVAKAKKEGNLRVLTGDGPTTISHLINAFKKQYPFINVYGVEISREGSYRFSLSLTTATEVEWDLVHIPPDHYLDYLQHTKKFDILGMAEQKVLAIPPEMIDSVNRNIVAIESTLQAVAFNRCLLDPSKVPNTWEDFLKPDLKGKKFIVDIRPNIQTIMAAAAGEEWMVNYSKRLAAQDPVWARGQTSSLTAMLAGEYTLHSGANYHSAMRIVKRHPSGCLQVKVIEPVPVRIGGAHAALEKTPFPNAGLLWLEFMTSVEAQMIIDKYEPLKGSIFVRGTAAEKLIRGKKVWIKGLTVIDKTSKWMKMAQKAFGFPQAQSMKRK